VPVAPCDVKTDMWPSDRHLIDACTSGIRSRLRMT
jgi:hypothetical protein